MKHSPQIQSAKAIFLFLALFLVQSMQAQTNSMDSIDAMITEMAKPVYLAAYKVVNTARFKVNNAVKKKYPVKEAMDYYNENLSSYMGQYKTLLEVKKRLDTAGDAFIESIYLNEKGKIAKQLAEMSHERYLELKAEMEFEAVKKKQEKRPK